MLVSQLQNEVSLASNQLTSMKTQYSMLQEENRQEKHRLERTNSELSEMSTKLSGMISDLAASHEAKENLQRQVGMVREQMEKATSALAQKVRTYGNQDSITRGEREHTSLSFNQENLPFLS